MAKRVTDGNSGNKLARVRYFELEGSDETVQKALATFERMQRPIEVLTSPPKRVANEASSEPLLFDPPSEPDQRHREDGESSDGTEEPAERRKRSPKGSTDRNAAITAPGDVNFYPEGAESLQDLHSAKSPKTDEERCLLFCYFFQEVAKEDQFGAGHVLAAFTHVGKPIPRDLGGTLRNLREGKKGSKAWLRFADLQRVEVTTIGLNHVRHEMGQISSKGEAQ